MKKQLEWYDSYWKERDTQLKSPWHWAARGILETSCYVEGVHSTLEIGCGIRTPLRDFDFPCKVFMDISLEALLKSQQVTRDDYFICAFAEKLPFKNAQFDLVLLLEVIEHFSYPNLAVREMQRVLKKEGILILSFPNYLNIPWLALRLLTDLLKKPGWMKRQPIDKIYFYPQVVSLLSKAGFELVKTVGSEYYPPIPYRLPKKLRFQFLKLSNQVDGFLVKLPRSHIFSFHPVLISKKR